MEFQTVFSFEGPLATVQLQTLAEQTYEQPQPVQAGIFADRFWRATTSEFVAEIGRTYRVTIELAEEAA